MHGLQSAHRCRIARCGVPDASRLDAWNALRNGETSWQAPADQVCTGQCPGADPRAGRAAYCEKPGDTSCWRECAARHWDDFGAAMKKTINESNPLPPNIVRMLDVEGIACCFPSRLAKTRVRWVSHHFQDVAERAASDLALLKRDNETEVGGPS